MRYVALPARSLGSAHIAAWQALHIEEPRFASPFFSPHFTLAVAEGSDDVYVIVIERDGVPVGFLPYERQRRGRRHAGPVGSILNDCQGAITAPGLAWSPSQALRASGLSLWDFDHLIADDGPLAPYGRADGASPLITLDAGIDGYAAERRAAGSRQLEQVRRKWRKLIREEGSDRVRFEAVSRDRTAFEAVIRHKIEQCERTGSPVFFRERWARVMVERLRDLSAPGCTGALSVLWVGDRVAAAHFGLRSGRYWHWWFPVYDPAFARYSPGKLLLLKLCEHVASVETSETAIDLGKGDETYKASFSNAEYPLREGYVAVASPYAAVREAKRASVAWARETPLLAHVRDLRRSFKARRAGDGVGPRTEALPGE
ncbi:MAG: GNAT family N-acetyltransferase [Pseudomonadota bacterium]